jgi:hypothetical protein
LSPGIGVQDADSLAILQHPRRRGKNALNQASVLFKLEHYLLFDPDGFVCKSVEPEENHEKAPRWSWARMPMGNIK